MDGAIAVLAQINLVDIRVHHVGLGKARLENDRHQRFLDFAPQRLAIVEKVAANQLLRERRAALFKTAGANVHPRGPHDAHQIDAVMSVELAILDHLERGG